MDYQKLIEYRMELNPFAKLLGIRIEDASEGYCKGSLEITKDFTNPIGSVHGGVLYTLADVMSGTAAATTGYTWTTTSGEYHYLRAGLNTEKIYAEARVIKAGKKLAVFDVEVTDQSDAVLGRGTFTFYNLGKEIDLDAVSKKKK